MAYKFQFGPSTMSGTLEQEGTLDITNSGLFKIAGSTLSDASRNVTAVGLSGSGPIDLVGPAHFKGTLKVSGACLAGAGITSTGGANTFGASSFNDANITNVGSIALDSILADDGASFAFGSNWTAAGRTCANLGTVTTATSITATDLIGTNVDGILGADTARAATVTALSLTSIASNWTNAGRTVADGGIFTTLDLNGGSIDGTTIGAAVPSSVKATTLSGSGNADVVGTVTAHGLVRGNAGFAGTTLSASSTLSVVGAGTFHGLVRGNAGFAGSTLSASSTLSVVGAATVHGATVLNGSVNAAGVIDAAAALAADSFYYLDATDGLMKRESMVDYAAAIAGDGLIAASGVLAVSLTELTEAAVNVSADSLIFIDADGNVTRRDTFVDYATAIAGTTANTGLAQASGGLTLDIANVTAAAIASTDTLLFNDQTGDVVRQESIDDIASLFAGDGLKATSAVIALDINELASATVNVAADSIAIVDANASNASKKESIADLVAAMAGGGLTATAGVLSTQAGGTPQGIADANGTLTEGMNYGTTTFTADRTWTLPASPDVGDVVHAKAPISLGSQNLIILKGAALHRIDTAESVVIESDAGAVSLTYAAANTWILF